MSFHNISKELDDANFIYIYIYLLFHSYINIITKIISYISNFYLKSVLKKKILIYEKSGNSDDGCGHLHGCTNTYIGVIYRK